MWEEEKLCFDIEIQWLTEKMLQIQKQYYRQAC